MEKKSIFPIKVKKEVTITSEEYEKTLSHIEELENLSKSRLEELKNVNTFVENLSKQINFRNTSSYLFNPDNEIYVSNGIQGAEIYIRDKQTKK